MGEAVDNEIINIRQRLLILKEAWGSKFKPVQLPGFGARNYLAAEKEMWINPVIEFLNGPNGVWEFYAKAAEDIEFLLRRLNEYEGWVCCPGCGEAHNDNLHKDTCACDHCVVAQW